MLTSILKSILFVCWKKGYNTVQYGLENRDTGSQKSTVQTQHTYSNFIKIRYSKKGGKYIISFKVLSFLRDYTVCFCHRRWNHPVELSDEDLKSGREEDFFTLKLFSSISVAWFCLFFRNLPPKSPVKHIICRQFIWLYISYKCTCIELSICQYTIMKQLPCTCNLCISYLVHIPRLQQNWYTLLAFSQLSVF